MLGHTPKEIIGKSIIDLLSPEEIPLLEKSKERLLHPIGHSEISEWKLKNKNGNFVPAEVNAKILSDNRWMGIGSYMILPLNVRGTSIGILYVASKIDRHRFTIDDLSYFELISSRSAVFIENARLYQEATRAINSREQVLSIVSHDLKNPLTSIDLSAELLLLQELNRTNIETISRRLKNASETMLRLISDLLDFGKMEAGVFSVDLEVVTIDDALTLAMESLNTKSIQSGVNLMIVTRKNLNGMNHQELLPKILMEQVVLFQRRLLVFSLAI